MSTDRVVVTGLGVVTPLGNECSQVWGSLLEGRNAFAEVSSFDTSDYPVHVGAEVRDFDPSIACQRLDPSEMGRASQLAVSAARAALVDAAIQLPMSLEEASIAGVAMGTTSGEPIEIENFNDHFLARSMHQVGGELVDRYPCHNISANVAAELELTGPNVMIPAACAAGNYAIAHAFDALRARHADIMLAGGADAFSRITYTGFARLGAIAPDVCRPFDKERQGMIPGEGAAVLVLERLEDALNRGAKLYAEVTGYGLSCDAHHMTAAHPEGRGAARAMQKALAMSGLQPEDVSYISAHGTGTPTNDKLETIAVKRVFGATANKIPMSSIKSMMGHTMGAASAIEAAVCSLAVSTDRIPPTANYEEPDPECDLDYVTDGPRETDVDLAMNNAYAFGGCNASVLFRKLRDVA